MCETAHACKSAFKEVDAMRICCDAGEPNEASVTTVQRAPSLRCVLNGTARIPRAAHTEVMSNETNPQSLSNVRPGDVLVSHQTAVREHASDRAPDK
jgi:hypothetical protein